MNLTNVLSCLLAEVEAHQKVGWIVGDLHFPLSLLAYGQGDDWAEVRLCGIIAWAAESRGEAKLNEEGFNENNLASVVSPEVWEQVEADNRHTRSLVWAASTIGGRFFVRRETHTKQLRAVHRFCAEISQDAGQSPFVRVPTDFAVEAMGVSDKPGMSYREFSVLCAVYSCIGNKEVAIVRREQIRLRQTGAWNKKSIDLLTVDGSNPLLSLRRATLPKLLTIDQLRYTLDELEGRRLFSRLTAPNKRDVYFSRRLNANEMAPLVAGHIRRRATKLDKTAAQALLAAALSNSLK